MSKSKKVIEEDDVMKIFLFTSVLSGGGAERVLCQLANGLSVEHNVTLIASYKTDNEYFVDSSVDKIYIDNIKHKSFFRQITRLRKLAWTKKPDVCISFLPHPNFKLLISMFGLKTKTIISVRNDPEKEYASIVTRILAYTLYPFSNGIVFQTRDAQSFFPESIRKKSAVIMNQVDKRFFNIKRGTGEYWLATGRLEKQKNYPLMITAFANVCRRHPDEVLKIYGEGSEKESLRKLIKQLGMEHNILLMGVTNDVPQQLKNAKGFILSSDYEGMPNGLLEALAAGVPCIATDCPCGGPREVIHTGINGVLVSINNKIELESAIEKILCDPEFSNRLEINAREMALKFNPVNILGDWTDYIRKVRCE